MNNLNILEINSSKTWAGGETHLKDLIKGLDQKSHNITLVIREHIKEKFIGLDLNIEVLPLKNAVDLYSIYKLVKIIKDNNIDIIHVHNGKDYWLAFFAKLLSPRVKIVATRHILVPLSNTFLHKIMFSKIDHFIAVSNEVKNKLVNQNRIDENKIEVIYNGMDVSHYKNCNLDYLYKEFNLNQNDFLVGIVGTICDLKNQKLFIEIAKKIEEENIKFLIVGDDFTDEQKYKNKIIKKVEESSIKEKVIFTGYREDIPEIMNLLDVLLIPSKSEAFGLVAIEAMAAKTIVMANRVDGLKEIINKEIGYLIEDNNKEEYKNGIIELYKNKDKLDIMKVSAENYVMNNFEKEKMIIDVVEIFEKVLKGSNNGY